MTAIRLPRSQGRGGVAAGAGVAIAAILAGAAAGRGLGLPALALAIFAAACLLGIRNWRGAVHGLLLYLPVSGLPVILTYPHTTIAVLVKDFLFVLPAYIGFLAWSNSRGRSISFRSAPVLLFLALGVLVVAQAFNPALPNRLVGAIGIKVWLLYMPLVFLGYHLLRTRDDLGRVLTLMSVSAMLPIVLGILEAVLVNGGHSALVYRLYGDAAAATTQDFNSFNLQGGGSIKRVSSLFSFVTQYYTFAASMVAVTYAWWRGFFAGTPRAWLGRLVWMLTIAGAILSGARGAILFVPLLVLLTTVFDRGLGGGSLARIATPVVLLLAAISVFKTPASVLLGHVWEVGKVEFGDVFVHGFSKAFELTWAGLGTGIDTNASRYAFQQQQLFVAVGNTWYESWYVRALLELGIAGLALVVTMLGVLLARGRQAHRSLRDPKLRAVSAGLLAFLVWNLIYNIKGQYMNVDPIDVYFWLFAGMLARLPVLEREEEERAWAL